MARVHEGKRSRYSVGYSVTAEVMANVNMIVVISRRVTGWSDGEERERVCNKYRST